jgi:hypothetical protein
MHRSFGRVHQSAQGAQGPREEWGRKGSREGSLRAEGQWDSGKGPNSLALVNSIPFTIYRVSTLCQLLCWALGTLGWLRCRGKRGRGRYRDNTHNTGAKCLRGSYKVLWELRAAGHSFFPWWRSSLEDFTGERGFELGLADWR